MGVILPGCTDQAASSASTAANAAHFIVKFETIFAAGGRLFAIVSAGLCSDLCAEDATALLLLARNPSGSKCK